MSNSKNLIQIVSILILTGIGIFALNSLQQKPSEKQSKEKKIISAEVQPGFVLYPVVGTAQVHLLNVQGKKVHTWNLDAQRARLLPNCNLLVVHGSKWGTNVEPWKTLKFELREYDWNGELVWNFKAPGRVHHDVNVTADGNYIFPIRTVLSKQKQATLTDPKRRNAKSIRSDSIIEVNRDKKIVWRWNADEHLEVNSCGKPECHQENAADWSHINTVSIIPPNKWFDNGDTRFRPGNILTLFRNWWTAMIIDKESGEVVWHYIGDYKGGLSGGHEAVMIEKGLPGAGNIMIFDNGRSLHKGESYILEIKPTDKSLVKVYDRGSEFFSNSAGAAQRLPNGNTLISEDLTGRVFEIDTQDEIVWQFKGKHRIARAKKYLPNYCPKLAAK